VIVQDPHGRTFIRNEPMLVDAWCNFLSKIKWEVFITFTFVSKVHPEAAEKMLHKYFHILNCEIYGKNYSRRDVHLLWFGSLEYQRRGVIHFHCLVKNIPFPYNYRRLQKMWLDLGANNGWTKVERILDLPACMAYVLKYVVKDGEIIICPQMNSPQVILGIHKGVVAR